MALVALESSWKYRDAQAAPPPDWNSRTFDDSAWAQGNGLLHAGNPNLSGAGEGLLGYWPLEETSGVTAPNAAPGGTAGALNGAVTWVTNDPVRGHVLSFPGTAGAFVNAGSIPFQTISNDFTWSFWANSSETGTNDVILGNRYAASGADFNPREFIKFTTSQFEFHHDGGADGISYAAIATGVWQHHAVVKSGSELTYYRDGVAAGTHTISAGTNNPQPLYFGGNAAQEPWSGLLDDVAIWTKALPASSIQSLAGGTVTPLTAPTGGTTAALGTELTQGPTAHYFRRAFTINDPKSRVTLKLQHLIDDGAIFYLNGTEILRTNMPDGAVTHSTAASTNITTSSLSGEIVIPSESLVIGANVLAVEVHQAAESDLVFGAALTASIAPAPAQLPGSGLVFGEISAATDSNFRVELTNLGNAPVDLDGYRITTSAGQNVTLAAQPITVGGFAVLTPTELGFTPVAGDVLFLYQPGGTVFEDARQVTNKLRGRDPKGRWLFPSGPTFGAVNTFTFEDRVVINEIMYHQHVTGDPREQWIELHNRSAEAVDVSGWKFDEGISFTFPPGTMIAPGDYLVVANDATSLQARWPAVAAKIIGNFSGNISRRGELIELEDAAGNPADEVNFADGGRWPADADGGGSSLELRDPRADNTAGEAWAASDESARGSWQNFTLEAPASNANGDPTRWNEFIFGLLDRGTYLIDDISVIESPAGVNRQLIQNGTFDTGATGWRFLGTQRHASVVTDPTGEVLRVDSTGPTEHMHNHAETTLKNGALFVTINTSLTYRISFRARWVSGTNLLNARLYFNRLAQTVTLPIAPGGGTPGSANSTMVANLGPTFSHLAHAPVMPASGEACVVSVVANDPDNVASLSLFYSVNGAAFANTPMAPRDGVYSAAVPAQNAGVKVQFYVEATDGAGAISFFPQGGPDSRAIIPWQDNQARLTLNGVQPNNVRVVMTQADAVALHTVTNVMSNDRLGCTVIYNEREIYYDCGVHLHGSMVSRANLDATSFNMKFPADRKFRGVHRTVQLNRGVI
ncbi:MAG: lamin tail domain-containing protein, partial [Chthoniobacteraceae bacterium]